MIELFIKSKISPISIFSVRINDFEKYYVNANEKTENEIMHAFLVSDNPCVDMGMYGTEIFEGQYSMIKEGDKLSFSIEFDMDKDEVRFFDGLSENSLTYPIPDTAKYKEGRTKANMDTMDIPDNLSDLSEAFSEKDTGVSFMFHSDLEDYAKEYIKESLGFEPKVSVSDNAYPYGIKIDINGREFYFDKDADAEGMLDGIVETLESELADKKRYYIVHNGVFKDTVEFLGYFESIDDAKEYAFERMHNFDLLVGSDNVDISYGLGSDGYFMWNMVEDKEKLFLCEYTYQNKTDDPIGLWYWTSDCDKPHKDEVLYYRNGKVFEEDKQIIEEVKAKSR
jgi:hypothetical protein